MAMLVSRSVIWCGLKSVRPIFLAVQRAVGKTGEFAHHACERESARQIAHRERGGKRQPLAPQRHFGVGMLALRQRPCQRRLALSGREQCGKLRLTRKRARQKRCVGAGAGQSALPVGALSLSHHPPLWRQQAMPARGVGLPYRSAA